MLRFKQLFSERLKYLFFLFIFICFSGELSAEKYILLVDQSGSLVKNDPADLRKDALKFFIKQIQPEDYLGIYTFGEGAQEYDKNGETFIEVGSNLEWIAQIINNLKRRDPLTDLRKGLQIIDNNAYVSNEPIDLLIFTDAQLKYGDIPGDVDLTSYVNDIYKLGVKLREKNVTIYGLAFTKSADLSYLQRLASITGGNAILAQFPEVANQSILDLINKNKHGPFPPDKNIPIHVDNTIESFKVFAFNSRIESTLPKIKVFDPEKVEDKDLVVNRFRTSITAEKINPQVGLWSAFVKGASDVQVYFTKKVSYNIVFIKPTAIDLNTCKGSKLEFDIEVQGEVNVPFDKFTAFLAIYDQSKVNHIRTDYLKRKENRFLGVMDINFVPGTYNVEATVSAPKENITRNFVIHVDECADFSFSVDHDVVIGHPAIIYATKPENIAEGEFKAILCMPDGNTKEYSLFDDGKKGHEDALANDLTFSNRIEPFEMSGEYNLEISLSCLYNNIPVINRKSTSIYKILEVKPEKIRMKFPRRKAWKLKQSILLNNRTDLSLNISDSFVEKPLENIQLSIPEHLISIGGHEKKEIEIEYEYSGDNLINKKIINIDCYLKGDAPDIGREVKISFDTELVRVASSIQKMSNFLLVVIIIIIVVALIGLLIVVPLRFKNHTIIDENQSYSFYNDRQIFLPYVILPSGKKLGITLLGFGSWYLKDDSGITKGKQNIDGLEKEFY
jgi:hypothetical protein